MVGDLDLGQQQQQAQHAMEHEDRQLQQQPTAMEHESTQPQLQPHQQPQHPLQPPVPQPQQQHHHPAYVFTNAKAGMQGVDQDHVKAVCGAGGGAGG
jgi:hypothetical protein